MRIIIFLYIFLVPAYIFAQDGEEQKTDLNDPSEKAGAFYQDAVQLYGEARYRESIDAFNQAILIDPQSVYFCNRAVVLLEMGEVSKAFKDFQACEKNFEGEPEELATINTQRLGVQAGVNHAEHAKRVSVRITADNLYVPPEKGWSLTSWGLLSLGVGAGLIGSAVTIDFLSEDLVSSFVRESEGRDGTQQAEYDRLKSDLETRQYLFYGLSIGGAVASVLGLSLIIMDLGSETEELALGFELKPSGANFRLSF